MATVVFDCETIADVGALSEADVATLVECAANREQPVEKFAATCPALARVVLVGLRHVESGARCVVLDTDLMDCDADAADLKDVKVTLAGGEAGVLDAVHGMLAKVQGLVTFNGRSFDVPLLLLRAMRHGMKPANVLQAAAWQKPWESRPHVDVLNLLTFGGATGRYPLAAYGIGLGAGNPKANSDGSMVGDLVAAREGTKLAAYCLRDVSVTAALAAQAGVIEASVRGAAA